MKNKMDELENLSDDEINEMFMAAIGYQKESSPIIGDFYTRKGDIGYVSSDYVNTYANNLNTLNEHLKEHDLIRIRKTLDATNALIWNVEIFLGTTGFVHALASDIGRAIRIALIRVDCVTNNKKI